MPQMPSIPYASPSMYNPDRGTERLIDLMLRRGDVEARGQAASGEIWGRAVQDVGQIAAGAVQHYGEQKAGKKRAEAFQAFISDGQWAQDPAIALAGAIKLFGPEEGARVARALIEFPKITEKADAANNVRIGHTLVGLEGLSDEEIAPLWPGIVQKAGPVLATQGVPMDQIPPEWDGKFRKQAVTFGRMLTGEKAAQTPDQIRAEAQARAEGTAAGTPVKPPALQTLTVPGPNGPMAKSFTPEQVAAGVPTYKAPPASLVINPQKEADSEANAQMMVDGRALPTTFSKRGSDFNHLIAKADKLSKEQGGKGFNPIKLQLDFEASKRFVGALNSSQMVRFKGLAGSVVNTIDEVKALAEQLKQGGVQKWNQAKRDTILQVYGNTPQSVLAAQYMSAVNTLKEEFANLAQGGYAPTEAAWKLAEQQINGNYGLKDFNASVTEAQRLINYRLGAFDELAPSLLGGGGQSFGGAGQGAAPAGGPKELTYNPKTGKLE